MGTSVPPPGFVAPSPPVAPAPEPRDRRKLLFGVPALGILAAAAFLFLGSSGGGLGGPIAQAAAQTSRVAGYRMHMSVQVSSSASGPSFTATGSGVVDLRHHASSISLVMSGAAANLRMDMIKDGTTVYLKVPSTLGSALPTGGRPWVKGDLSKLTHLGGLSSATSDQSMSDPTRILDALRSVSDGVVNEGQELIGGRSTTHYQAEVIPGQLLHSLGTDINGRALTLLQHAMPATIPVDVWVDAQHLVRRVGMTLNLNLPQGPSLQETLSLDLSHYGPQATPSPPPPDQVTDLSSLSG